MRRNHRRPEAARKAGENKKALDIYTFFINKYPDSDFINYCRGECRKLGGKP
ncbi:MAG: hypothetical protein V3W31_08690 [Thermodesulfobacteriota bacterium]